MSSFLCVFLVVFLFPDCVSRVSCFLVVFPVVLGCVLCVSCASWLCLVCFLWFLAVFCVFPGCISRVSWIFCPSYHLFTFSPVPSPHWPRDGRFGSKVGQIGPKWDKTGAFSYQISVHLARLKSDLKKPRDLSHLGPHLPSLCVVKLNDFLLSRDVIIGTKLSQMNTKWDKSGTF